MRPQHIRVPAGKLAERIVAVGDPARAQYIAENILKDSELVNRERGFYIYTGYYNGVPVSVAVHGIGAPSAAIVFEELYMLGARVIVRLGTAGALIPELDIGDFVVATSAAYTPGGTIGLYVPDSCMPASPDPILTTLLYNKARTYSKRVLLGPVFSSDAFYAEDEYFVKKWSSRGIVAVEMEVATLYTLAIMRKFKASALLVISDNLTIPEKKELRHHKELEPYINTAARAVLDTLIEYERLTQA